MIAAAGRMMTHAKAIGFIRSQFAVRLTMPTPSTAPMRMWVEDTGSASTDAAMTTPAAASSAVNPDAGCISVSPVPTVLITLRPMNHRPQTRPMPQASIRAPGTAASALISSVRSTSTMAAKGPTALAMSFEPWLNANADAVNTCIQLNSRIVDRDRDCRFRVLAKR